MAEPDKRTAADLTPEEQGQIETAVMGPENLKGLKSPELVQKIIDILNAPDKSFIDQYKKIKRVIDKMKLEPEEREKIDKRVTMLVMAALEKNRDKIEKKSEALKKKEELARKKLLDDPEYKEALSLITQELKDKLIDAAEAKKQRVELKKKMVDDVLEKDDVLKADINLGKVLGNLLKLIDDPPDHIEELEDELAELEEVTVEKKKKEKEEEKKKKEEMERTVPKLMKVPDPVDKGKDEGNGVFKKPEDIKKAQIKWAAVENDLGRPPKEGDALFWKPTKEGEEPEALSTEETERYRAFIEFMKKAEKTGSEIKDALDSIKIPLEVVVDGLKRPKTPAEVSKDVLEAAEKLIRKMLEEPDPAMTALLFHVLKVDSKPAAFEKLQNIIHFQTTVDVPGKYALYEVAVSEEGLPIMLGMDDFLSRHTEYGAKMITDSYEILESLHNKYGDAYGDIESMRDVLIEVIKTRGNKDIAVNGRKISRTDSMGMYTDLLLALDPHMGEKELLSLLIAFKARPPYVFDLINTTDGWELGNKKTGMHVLKDFAIDGSIYLEVKNKLGVSGPNLNKFLIKIAPWFEKIRSKIASKKEGEDVALAEITAFLPEFTAEDLVLFKKLMNVQRWPDKVGHAFKYAKYLSDADIYVPHIQETQGPVTRDINVTFVNVEEKLKRIADRLSDERLDQELKELGPQGWKELWRMDKIGAKWWKRNAMEGYREKYREDFMKRLKEDPKYRTELMGLNRAEVKPGGLGAKMSGAVPAPGVRDARANINADLDAIAEKFGIAWEEGDTESYLTENERTPEALANVAVQEAIRDLCKDFENDTVDEAGFRDRVRNNIVPMIQAMQDPPDSAVVAFLEESGSTKADIDKLGLLDKMKAHKADLIALDLDNMKINLRLGKAMNVDVKTQVKNLGWLDKASRRVVERAQRNKFLGRFVSPATMAVVGYGLGNVVGQLATSSTVRAATALSLGLAAPSLAPALAGVAGACLVGGAFAGLRQRKEVLGLKAMKERRDALGYAPADDTKGLPLSKIERDMEKPDVLYTKEPASVLINNIKSAADYNTRISTLAEAIVRNEISEMGVSAEEKERVDLIRFEKDSDTTVEKQRFALLRTISQGKIDARGENPDADNDLAVEVAARRDAIIAQMRVNESVFNKLKRRETLKAAGVGAAIAGVISGAAVLISHYSGALSETTSKTVNLTPAGPTDPVAFENALLAYGVSKSDATQIMSMLKYDAAGNLDPAVAASIKSQFGIDVTGMLAPGGVNLIPVGLNGGLHMSQADLIREVHAIDPSISSSIHFGADGKLTPASIALLRANNFNVVEHVSTTAGTGTAPFTPGPDWTKISKIHFNDNMPHTPGSHILDELKLWWNGKPALGSDGNYHFTVKDMFNPNTAHSHLPPGVTMPADPTGLKIGMQVKAGGTNYWKFFTPDSNGDIKIPPSYFDQASIGPVPRGGSVLPGLKTDAMAVMFDDKNGTTQVLASVRGQGGFSPPTSTVDFTGEFIKPENLPDVTGLSATATTEEMNAWAAAVPVAGAPMKHLEYGKAPKSPDVPPKSPDAPKTPGLPPKLAPPPPPRSTASIIKRPPDDIVKTTTKADPPPTIIETEEKGFDSQQEQNPTAKYNWTKEKVDAEIPDFKVLKNRLENYDSAAMNDKERDLLSSKLDFATTEVNNIRYPDKSDLDRMILNLAVLADMNALDLNMQNKNKVLRRIIINNKKLHPDQSTNAEFVAPVFKALNAYINACFMKLGWTSEADNQQSQ